MRFLADMGVSGRVVDRLRGEGHEATHVRDDGLHRAEDRVILAKAAGERRIVLTFDLDFGVLLASSGGAVPSVIIFRLHDTTTSHVRRRLAEVLPHVTAALDAGAVVVIEDGRYRVRSLPIGS